MRQHAKTLLTHFLIGETVPFLLLYHWFYKNTHRISIRIYKKWINQQHYAGLMTRRLLEWTKYPKHCLQRHRHFKVLYRHGYDRVVSQSQCVYLWSYLWTFAHRQRLKTLTLIAGIPVTWTLKHNLILQMQNATYEIDMNKKKNHTNYTKGPSHNKVFCLFCLYLAIALGPTQYGSNRSKVVRLLSYQ